MPGSSRSELTAAAPAPTRAGAATTFGPLVVCVAGICPLALVGALGPQLSRELAISPPVLGAISTGFLAASSLSAIALGRVVDRIGWARSSRIAAVVVAALLVAGAAAPSGWVLLVTLTLGGAAHALATLAAYSALAVTPLRHRQGLLFGAQQASIPVALLLAGLALPLVAVPLGWRWTFAGAAVLALASALCVPRAGKGQTRAARTPLPRAALPTLVVFALAGACGGAVTGALLAFAGSSAVHAGTPEATTGVLLAVASVLNVATRVGSGALVDTGRVRAASLVAWMMGVGTLGFGLLALGAAGVWSGTLLAFTAGWGWTGLYAFAVVTSNPRTPGAASAVGQMGLAGGAAAGPLLFGLAVTGVGYPAAWIASAVICLVGAVLAAVAGPRLLPPG